MVSAEEFIVTWQGAASLADVAKRLKITEGGASVRACHYRRRGIPLRCFPRGRRPLDVAALARVAKKHAVKA